MKKAIIIFVSIGGFLFIGIIAARLTHVIDVYNISTESNKPTLMPGSIIFASRLKAPALGSFVCYRPPGKKEIWVSRCIGIPGDVIEIKNASVFVNGHLLDEPYTWNDYYISRKELNTIQGYVDTYKYPLIPTNDTLSVITFSKDDLKRYNLDLKGFTAVKGKSNPDLFFAFAMKGFNEDNLGPVKVLPGCYFLMSYNRHNAMDSRYLGFIDKNIIVSTVIN